MDKVGDGCWTNIGAVKTAVELEIKRSGFKLADDKYIFPTNVSIVSIGGKLSDNSCVATLRIEVWGPVVFEEFISDGNKINFIGQSILWQKEGVVIGGKKSTQCKPKRRVCKYYPRFPCEHR